MIARSCPATIHGSGRSVSTIGSTKRTLDSPARARRKGDTIMMRFVRTLVPVTMAVPCSPSDLRHRVDRATIVDAAACLAGAPTVPLTTSVHLVGAGQTPVWVHATADWHCNGRRLTTP